jgi:hypothetical protein
MGYGIQRSWIAEGLLLPLRPLGAERVGVRWGEQRLDGVTHLTLPVADATGPLPLPPQAGGEGDPQAEHENRLPPIMVPEAASPGHVTPTRTRSHQRGIKGAGTALQSPRAALRRSDDLSFPQIVDLRRGVIELGKDLVIVRAEFRGDADPSGRFGEVPR